MTLRERIKKMIEKANEHRGQSTLGQSYWNGYNAFGYELLLHVKPKDKEE